jgi:hypothetical protein
VEFAVELVEQARLNFAVSSVAQLVETRVELVCGDVTTYHFPDGPLIVYLFNPFGPAIIRRVAANVLASWKEKPRPVEIVYVNPVQLSEFVNTGWSICKRAGLCAPSTKHTMTRSE